MQTLYQMLKEADEAVILAIAEAWGVKSTSKNTDELRELLHHIMLTPTQAERLWETLNDPQRQALQTLLGSQNNRMQMSMFKRFFGDIRRLGVGGVEREQPHKHSDSAAEVLFYRGLIAESYAIDGEDAQTFAYVPDDLASILPVHKTAYEHLESEVSETVTPIRREDITETRPADTSIVDDLTTMLAFLQLQTPTIEDGILGAENRDLIAPHLLNPSDERIAFLLDIGISAGMIVIQDGRILPERATARSWLSAHRSKQIELLIQAWLESTHYQELWHVSELHPERLPGYDPRRGRQTALKAMRDIVPDTDWWDIDEFIHHVKETDADFQRPNGDYDSWYIQDFTGEYVRGFESWDTVEASLLEFIIFYPMHWLGLVDTAPEAARLTAYGRGTLQRIPFPHPTDKPEPIVIQPDGVLLISRKVSRLDRFQAARFTAWQPVTSADAPYTYTINMQSLDQAEAQGIQAEHINSFLKRFMTNEPIPEQIANLLKHWRTGDGAVVTLTSMVVLRTTSEDTLNMIFDTPELRRYLGSRLGPTAVAVRPDQASTLASALTQMGIPFQES